MLGRPAGSDERNEAMRMRFAAGVAVVLLPAAVSKRQGIVREGCRIRSLHSAVKRTCRARQQCSDQASAGSEHSDGSSLHKPDGAGNLQRPERILAGLLYRDPAVTPGPLKRDEIRMNCHRALALCLSMIFSENRSTLFRIML